MPYVFGGLVVFNVILFGIFWLKPASTDNGSYDEVKATIQKPIHYQNNSKNIPPPIGKK